LTGLFGELTEGFVTEKVTGGALHSMAPSGLRTWALME
jgi:hypothetical protein